MAEQQRALLLLLLMNLKLDPKLGLDQIMIALVLISFSIYWENDKNSSKFSQKVLLM